MLKEILLAGTGGFVGASGRFALGMWITARTVGRPDFPYATFAVNIVGSLVIGILWAVHMHHFSVPRAWQILLFTGVLGGFTTFSTFGWETLTLLQSGHFRSASIYVVGSLLLGVAAAWAGYSATAVLARSGS